MGRKIVRNLVWLVVFFVALAVSKYFRNESDWLTGTIHIAIPTVIAYFIGYLEALIDASKI